MFKDVCLSGFRNFISKEIVVKRTMAILLGLTLMFAPRLALAQMAKAELIDTDGKKIGVATFTEGQGGVKMVVHVLGLSPGLHGLHIHQEGKADPPDFKSAGGHYNPFAKKHGLMAAEGSHVGDTENMLVGPDGVGVAVRLLPLATLGEGQGSLFKPGGTAVVIHSGPDDNHSDPAGNAGSRVACGVILLVK